MGRPHVHAARLVLSRARIETPIGPMVALAGDAGLCALEFDDPGRQDRLERHLGRWIGPFACVDRISAPIEQARAWLRAYFAGTPPEEGVLALDPRGSPFERRVWAALLHVAPGETTTYGALARQIGAPGAARAVGLANGANALALVIPCHRVIGAGGSLVGYGGGLDRKRWLLEHERRWRKGLLF
jgi:O-6-methylguanine DNA methyltransferase